MLRFTIFGIILAFIPVHAGTQPQLTMANQQLTPGALNPAVTDSNLNKTICSTDKQSNGFTWVHDQRPPASYTTALKLKQLADPRYGYTDKNPKHYEEDHVCSIENAGNPRDARNLRPEPYLCMNGDTACKPANCLTTPGAKCKDLLEDAEHKLICAHKMTPAEACKINAGNWLPFYAKFVGSK